MSTAQATQATKATQFCTYCKTQVTYHTEPVDHKRELIRTIFTLGIWIPIWLLVTFAKPKLCDKCGNPLYAD
jgi:hypothetical protein